MVAFTTRLTYRVCFMSRFRGRRWQNEILIYHVFSMYFHFFEKNPGRWLAVAHSDGHVKVEGNAQINAFSFTHPPFFLLLLFSPPPLLPVSSPSPSSFSPLSSRILASLFIETNLFFQRVASHDAGPARIVHEPLLYFLFTQFFLKFDFFIIILFLISFCFQSFFNWFLFFFIYPIVFL